MLTDFRMMNNKWCTFPYRSCTQLIIKSLQYLSVSVYKYSFQILLLDARKRFQDDYRDQSRPAFIPLKNRLITAVRYFKLEFKFQTII